MHAKRHSKRDSRAFATAENRADSCMPIPELHVFAYVLDAQNSVPDDSVHVLPHSPFVHAVEAVQKNQDDEPSYRGEAEVRLDQLSSCHIRQNQGNKSLHGGEYP